MAKQPQNHIGNKLAARAVKRGASEGQSIPGSEIKSVRPYRPVGDFPNAKGPVHSKGPNYPGTSARQNLDAAENGGK